MENQKIRLATRQTSILDQKERSWKTLTPASGQGTSPTSHEKPNLGRRKDPQAELNRTLHPSPNDEILLAYVEDLTEQNTIWINTKTSSSIEFHLKHDEEKKEVPLDKQIPMEYHEYLDVFDKEKAD